MADNKKNLQDINKLLKDSVELNQDQVDLYKERLRLAKASKEEEKLVAGILKDINSEIEDANQGFSGVFDRLKSITEEMSKQYSSQNQMTKGLKSMTKEVNKLVNEESNISSFNRKQLLSMQEKIKIEKKRAIDNAKAMLSELHFDEKSGKYLEEKGGKIAKLTEAQTTAAGVIKDETVLLEEINKLIKKRIGLEDKFTKGLGFAGGAAAGLDKALQKAGIPSLGIASAIEQAKKEFVSAKGKSSALGLTIKNLAINMGEALSFANMFQASVGFLMKSMMAVDKAAGDFAKNQGISYAETLKLKDEMIEVAQNSGDILVSSRGLLETQGRLNELMGSNVKFSNELTADMTSIALRTKMSAETQELLAMQSIKTGKGAKDILKSQKLKVIQLNKEKGLTMSIKKVQDAIGKSSKSLQLTFKGNLNELTNQVMAAKALGTNLAGVEGIASSLLDFESSIQAELEAELLLGQEINLEKARQAALEGDMAKVAEEVLGNKAIMNAFETKNVIAQEQAAKALGMNREQLAEMVKEQEQLEAVRAAGFDSLDSAQQKYNEDRAKGLSHEEASKGISDENLKAQLESASVADQFAATMERVQEMFAEMAVPILEQVQGLMAADGFARKLVKTVKVLTGLYLLAQSAIIGSNIATVLNIGLKKKETQEEKKKSLAKIGGVAAAFVSNPIGAAIGLALGLVAAGTMYAALKDGVIDPKKGPVVSGEFGTVQLHPDDQIVAGTDLMGEKKSGRGGGARRDAVLISEIQTLIGVNRQILAKSSTIEMNGNQVGQEINTSERAVQ